MKHAGGGIEFDTLPPMTEHRQWGLKIVLRMPATGGGVADDTLRT